MIVLTHRYALEISPPTYQGFWRVGPDKVLMDAPLFLGLYHRFRPVPDSSHPIKLAIYPAGFFRSQLGQLLHPLNGRRIITRHGMNALLEFLHHIGEQVRMQPILFHHKIKKFEVFIHSLHHTGQHAPIPRNTPFAAARRLDP